MEKIGSVSKVNDYLNRLSNSYEVLDNTNENKKVKADLERLYTEIKIIGKSKNISDILNTERAILRSELARCADDATSNLMKSSLTSAVTDLDNASNVFDIVKNPQEYSLVNRSISVQSRDRQGSLPKDAFHRFIDSHKSRLANRIKSAETNFEERLLLTERHANMETTKKEYMKLQAIALNIPTKEKSKEIER